MIVRNKVSAVLVMFVEAVKTDPWYEPIVMKQHQIPACREGQFLVIFSYAWLSPLSEDHCISPSSDQNTLVTRKTLRDDPDVLAS